MSIDINEIVADMMLAVKGSVGEDWKLVKGTLSTFLDKRKSRLELLAQLRIDNEISDDFFRKRIADEKKILESELHAVVVIGKAAAQRAANAAIEILTGAIAKLIPGKI